MRCPKRPGCFDKAGIRRRVLASSCYPAFFRGHQRVGTPEYLSMMRLRKIWAEGSFSVLKREHCISKIRKRGILAATEECLLAAMALNLKRMVNAIFRYPQIYCSAGTTVGFSSFFAFVNRSVIVHYQSDTILDILSGPNAPFGEKHKKEILTKKACKKLVILTSLFITVSLLRVLPSPQRFCR
ncbi:MAG: transposase [Clostridiales bacterium]|nr:transposase [Clostridiales bacterium]